MSPSKEWYEEASAAENEWVRAVILKKEHIAHDDALEIAEKARSDAESALGKDHPSHAVALQGLGLYYSAVKKDEKTALDYFDEARAIVGRYNVVLAEGFYRLGIFHYEEGDARTAEAFLSEALAIHRQSTPADAKATATTLVCLAYARRGIRGPAAGVPLLEEACDTYEKILSKRNKILLDTRRRLAEMRKEAGEE